MLPRALPFRKTKPSDPPFGANSGAQLTKEIPLQPDEQAVVEVDEEELNRSRFVFVQAAPAKGAKEVVGAYIPEA